MLAPCREIEREKEHIFHRFKTQRKREELARSRWEEKLSWGETYCRGPQPSIHKVVLTHKHTAWCDAALGIAGPVRRKATRERGVDEGRKKRIKWKIEKKKERERDGPWVCLFDRRLRWLLVAPLLPPLFVTLSFSFSLLYFPSFLFPYLSPFLPHSRSLARSLVRLLVSSRNKRRRGQWVPVPARLRPRLLTRETVPFRSTLLVKDHPHALKLPNRTAAICGGCYF